MTAHISDIIIHVDESLPAEEISRLEQDMRTQDGIVSACMSKKDHHLLMVSYNSDSFHSSDVLNNITRRGLHAELIGM